MCALAIAFEAGRVHEGGATEGAAALLEAMAFKATLNRTTFRLTRELETLGATAQATAGNTRCKTKLAN